MRMTFTITDSIARDFQILVPSGDRSSLIGDLLKQELEKRRALLIQACQAASADAETEKTIDEWQKFDEKIDGADW